MSYIVITKIIKDVRPIDIVYNRPSDPSIGGVINTYLEQCAENHDTVLSVLVEMEETEWLAHAKYIRELKPSARD